MQRWWGWWLLWVLPFTALVIALAVLFRRADNYLLFVTPYAAAVSGVALFGHRSRHGYWPWDFKRRKIDRYGYLAEGPPNS